MCKYQLWEVSKVRERDESKDKTPEGIPKTCDPYEWAW